MRERDIQLYRIFLLAGVQRVASLLLGFEAGKPQACLPQIITFLPGRFELYKQKRSNQRLLITPFSFSLKSSFFSQSGLARIRGKHLPEVIVASGRSSTRVSIGNIQQCTVLLVLMEVIDTSWDVVTDLPVATC